MDKKTELAIDLGQTIYTNTINSLTKQRNDLIEALQYLMEWQVKNVDKWDNRAYDFAAETIKKVGADKTATEGHNAKVTGLAAVSLPQGPCGLLGSTANGKDRK